MGSTRRQSTEAQRMPVVRKAWGYTPREVERIRRLVVVHRGEILRQWHEFFDA